MRHIRFGATIDTARTTPSRATCTTMIGRRRPNVWTDFVASTTASSPRLAMPTSRAANERHTRAVTALLPPDAVTHWRFKRRYPTPAGTLPSLWQRQNDANCAPDVRRRTTDASQTLVAGNPALFAVAPPSLTGIRRRHHHVQTCVPPRPMHRTSNPGLSSGRTVTATVL